MISVVMRGRQLRP